jgi:hypothetical protein
MVVKMCEWGRHNTTGPIHAHVRLGGYFLRMFTNPTTPISRAISDAGSGIGVTGPGSDGSHVLGSKPV